MSDCGAMNILVSVDDAYTMPLTVMLTSLFMHNDPEAITVWLLYTGLSDASRMQIAQLVENSGARMEQLLVDDSFFEGFPTASYISRETYLRLLSGDVLPRDTHRVLWLDADLVVTGSLRELYGTDFGKNALIACSYAGEIPKEIAEQCAALGIDPSGYINAGVMLINLDAWREADLRSEMLKVYSRGIPLKYADQDLVNCIFCGRIGYADPDVYNFKINRPLDEQALSAARDHARIIHFCGLMKPWMFSDIPLGDIWRSYYEQSPLRQTRLRLITRAGLSRFAAHAKDRGKHA